MKINMWRLVGKIIRYRPWFFALNGILWTFFYMQLLIPGLILRYFFDRLLGDTSLSIGLTSIIILLALSMIARIPLLLSARAVDITYRLTIETLLNRNLLERIFEVADVTDKKYVPSEILSRFRDDIEEVKWYLLWCLDMIARIVFVLCAVIIMAEIQPILTCVAFFPLLIISLITKLISKKIKKYRNENRQATENVTGNIGEIFAAIQAIQVGTKEDSVVKYFTILNDKRRRLALKDFLFTELQEAGFAHLVNLSTGMILLLIGFFIKNGTFTIGDLVLFVFYMTSITNLAYDWGVFLTRTKQTSVSFRRLVELLQGGSQKMLVEHKPVYLKGELPPIPFIHKSQDDYLHGLKIANLEYLYPQTNNGIKEINFNVKRGSFTVITGQVGSGKTTLLRVLQGLLNKQNGEIFWNDKRVTDPSKFFIPPRSAYIAQVPRLFSGTLRDNILMGLPEYEVSLSSAIDLAMMEEDIKKREKGMDTIIGSKGEKLSGGQIQRTAAARMFVRSTELFIFDDLSSALDVVTEQKLWEKVFKLEGATCIIVTHSRDVIKKADNIIVLKDGRINGEGKLDFLLETCEEMKRLWGTSLKLSK